MKRIKTREDLLDYIDRIREEHKQEKKAEKQLKKLEQVYKCISEAENSYSSIDYSTYYQYLTKILGNYETVNADDILKQYTDLKENPSLPKCYSGKTLFNKLQEWREMQGITIAELCDRLGWHYQQFYALDDDNRKVRAKLLSHVMDKLSLDMDWLLATPDEDGSTNAYVSVFKKYPPKILKWLASDEGKEAMLKAYGLYYLSKAKEELANDAAAVYEA